MAHGASDRAVAKELFISLNTARKHTHHIIQKLGVHSKLEAVVVAAREGLIRPL
jgi:DNA-binding NarL/FixJ family response regulator